MTFDIQSGVLKEVYNCDAHVTIPDSVTSIGDGAFECCTSLQSISIPDSVTSIGNHAFECCTSLQSLSISPKHFECDELPFHRTAIITCIAPLSDIPDKYRLKACVGFALNEQEYPREMWSNYIHYIRTHVSKMCEAACEHPELLRLLCREYLIDAASFSTFLNETLRREATELTALLLEYQHTYLNETVGNDLSLD